MSHRDSNRVSTAPNASMFGIPTNCTVPLSMKLSNYGDVPEAVRQTVSASVRDETGVFLASIASSGTGTDCASADSC